MNNSNRATVAGKIIVFEENASSVSCSKAVKTDDFIQIGHRFNAGEGTVHYLDGGHGPDVRECLS